MGCLMWVPGTEFRGSEEQQALLSTERPFKLFEEGLDHIERGRERERKGGRRKGEREKGGREERGEGVMEMPRENTVHT